MFPIRSNETAKPLPDYNARTGSVCEKLATHSKMAPQGKSAASPARSTENAGGGYVLENGSTALLPSSFSTECDSICIESAGQHSFAGNSPKLPYEASKPKDDVPGFLMRVSFWRNPDGPAKKSFSSAPMSNPSVATKSGNWEAMSGPGPQPCAAQKDAVTCCNHRLPNISNRAKLRSVMVRP